MQINAQPKWTLISLETLKKEGKKPLKTETLKSVSKVGTKRFFGRRSADGCPWDATQRKVTKWLPSYNGAFQ